MSHRALHRDSNSSWLPAGWVSLAGTAARGMRKSRWSVTIRPKAKVIKRFGQGKRRKVLRKRGSLRESDKAIKQRQVGLD